MAQRCGSPGEGFERIVAKGLAGHAHRLIGGTAIHAMERLAPSLLTRIPRKAKADAYAG